MWPHPRGWCKERSSDESPGPGWEQPEGSAPLDKAPGLGEGLGQPWQGNPLLGPGRRGQPGPLCCQHRSISPWSCFGEELVWTPGGGKHWIHLLALPPLQGCFFLVTSTMESKMSVVAGISFGIACFQVNLPCLAGEECRVKLAHLQRDLISVQSLACTKGTVGLSQGGAATLWIPLGFNLTAVLTPRAEAPALFP